MNESRQEKSSLFTSGDAQTVISICAACKYQPKLGVIIGKSGYGKTYVLKQFAKQQRVRYI